MANAFITAVKKISSTIAAIPAATKKSVKWFKALMKTIGKNTVQTAFDKSEFTQVPKVGELYFFFYDPKHKKTLPYYDKFPMVFPIEYYKDGFLGLNLHYLPPRYRIMLMDKLFDLISDDNFNEQTRLKVSYSILKSASKYRYFRPTIKRYLTKNIRSSFIKIHVEEWMKAVWLPSAQWSKASQQTVWKDSRMKF